MPRFRDIRGEGGISSPMSYVELERPCQIGLTLIDMASQILRMTWGGGFRPPLISLNLGITAPPKFHKIIFCM